MALSAAIHHKAAELGTLAVRMTTQAGSGHPSTGLALSHLTAALLYEQMRWDPEDPWHPAADRLVLSAGHAVPIIYAALADLGARIGTDPENARKLTVADLDQLRARDSVLDGHPNPAEGVPFFDAATGSLGMGLSVAAGVALGARLDGTERRVFVIIGDGESREGQVWEALDFIVDHKLTNVCAIFSANGWGQADKVSPQQGADKLVAKLKAFGWDAHDIDGHDPDAIFEVLTGFGSGEKPMAIVARTVKGWGAEALQNGNWHGKPLLTEKLEAAAESLKQTVAAYSDTDKLGAPPKPPAAVAVKRVDPRGADWPALTDAFNEAGFGAALEKGKLGTRKAYGAALRAAGGVLPQLAVLDGDVSNSTFTELFAKVYPERFVECKIAEQNMISVAAGLSAAGYIPVANSFAKFLTRGCDQIEMASISRANLKLVGSHSGISLAADGPSQMGLIDVGLFRAFSAVRGDDREQPLCWCYHPADAVAAYHCTRLMLQQPGMGYLRTHRPDVPIIYPPDTRFVPGGFHVLNPGDDLAIVTAGYMVHAAREAVALLAKQNIRATLVDAYSMPCAADGLVEVLQRAGRRALVVEDNYGSGLTSEVAEIAARAGGLRVETLICQRIPKSTRSADSILEYCGLAPAQVADHAQALLQRP